MLKKILFAVAVLALMVSSASAGDLLDEVASLDKSTITDAQIAIEMPSLDGLDVDALAGEAGNESKGEDAIEACFRRIGWGGWGGYNYCYRPYFCHYPSYYYCYRPVYYYTCVPTYTYYWGCY